MNIIDIINSKRLGNELTKDEINFFINGIMDETIKDYQTSSLLMAICLNGMSYDEVFNLTDAMIKSGDLIDLSGINNTTIDKHSTGGVGDKVTLVLAPILASLGFSVAKMSGRGLGHTGGTIDKLEAINGYNVELSKEDFLKQVNDIGISVISQTGNLAPADKKLYALRDVTGTVESISLIAASVMSKKIACGADAIVIDLKVGRGAFMKNIKRARLLAKYMTKIGEHYNKKVKIIISSMDTPLGKCIGNNLEIIEAMEFFDGKWQKDLGEVVLTIAGQMISAAKNIPYPDAMKQAKEVINNGQAKEKFYKWIAYQGGNIRTIIKPCKRVVITSPKDGYIKDIDALSVGTLVRDLGGGRVHKEDSIDHAVGFKIIKDQGEYVKKGDIIAEVYFNNVIPDIEKRAQDVFKFSMFKVNPKDTILMIL